MKRKSGADFVLVRRVVWLLLIVLLLVVLGGTMSMSYMTLIDFAERNRILLPWMFPIVLDTTIVVCTVIVLCLRAERYRRERRYAFVMFLFTVAISVAANMVHVLEGGTEGLMSVPFAMVVAGVPPLLMVGVTHILVVTIPAVDRALQSDREVLAYALPVRRREDSFHDGRGRGRGGGGVVERVQDIQGVAESMQGVQSVAEGGLGSGAGGGVAKGTLPAKTGPVVSAEVRQVADFTNEFVAEKKRFPTNKEIGDLLQKSATTGRKRLQAAQQAGLVSAQVEG